MKKMVFLSLVCIFLMTAAAQAQMPAGPATDLLNHYAATYSTLQVPEPLFAKDMVAKAWPDECYDNGTLAIVPDEYDNCSQGRPKVNQSYVWGLTRSGNIWFGTAANPLCLVIGGMAGTFSSLLFPNGFETQSFACTFDNSSIDNNSYLPAWMGDWRPPQIYEYNTATDTLTDRTPTEALYDNETLGIRSAGALGGVVLMAGPDLRGTGINIFAFADNGTFLGETKLAGYSNIRQWIEVEGQLYTGVSATIDGTGRILRWTGSKADPFHFEEVGSIDLDAANLAFHENRIFVTTWPSLRSPAVAGLWMSREILGSPLTSADNTTSWTKVWSVANYEPDAIVAHTYAGGALVSSDGTLYWGTMHVPFVATYYVILGGILHSYDLPDNITSAVNVPPLNIKLTISTSDPQPILATILGTQRATSIFSGKNFGTSPQIELLYGDEYLPVHDNASGYYTIAYDDVHRNKMPNPVPKWGPSGMGNFFNAYTWTMDKGFAQPGSARGALVGTFDWSFVAQQLAIEMIEQLMPTLSSYTGGLIDSATLTALILQALNQMSPSGYGPLGFGADLFVIRSADTPFTLESNNGLGNYLNYGIRTMLMPDPNEAAAGSCAPAYFGTANPFNLVTSDNATYHGGWELLRVYPRPRVSQVTPAAGQILRGTETLQVHDNATCAITEVTSYVFGVTDVSLEQLLQIIASIIAGSLPVDVVVNQYAAAYDNGTGLWQYPLDTRTLPDGIYEVLSQGIDIYGNTVWSSPVMFVVENPCEDVDGDGYGEGTGCLGPDCRDNDSSLYDNCTCIDADGDGYGNGPGCFGPDCRDNDSALHDNCTCIDADGDGYGDGPGCFGPDCRDNDSALHDNCTCIDADGDGYGVGPGCAGPDCRDNDSALHDDCSCADADGDGYGNGPGCFGPDCRDNDSALNEDCYCADTDGDGYGDGPGCAGIDCDDNDSSIHDDCPTCSVKLFLPRVSKIFRIIFQPKLIFIRGAADVEFTKETPVTWNTPVISTVMKIRINKRTILALVVVNGMSVKIGDIYKVRVGDCAGQLKARLL